MKVLILELEIGLILNCTSSLRQNFYNYPKEKNKRRYITEGRVGLRRKKWSLVIPTMSSLRFHVP